MENKELNLNIEKNLIFIEKISKSKAEPLCKECTMSTACAWTLYDTRSLLRELRAEIERLENKNEILNEDIKHEINRCLRYIEKVNILNEKNKCLISACVQKDETIRQLKERLCECDTEKYTNFYIRKMVYNTLAVVLCVLTLGFVDINIKYSDKTMFRWTGWVTRLKRRWL